MIPKSMFCRDGGENDTGAILSRREFVLAALAALISLPAAAKMVSIISKFASVPGRSFSGVVTPTWVPAGLLRDISAIPKAISFGEDVVYVLKASTGRVVAYSGVCTHAGCLVEYDRKNKIFVCPCHGGHFGLNGEVLAGPPPRALDRHEVKVSLERVMIGKKIEK